VSAGPIYHLVRSTTHALTLCSRETGLGAVTIATANVLIRHHLHICGVCVNQFQRIRYEREATYQPVRARLG